jgi:hypothetical protein
MIVTNNVQPSGKTSALAAIFFLIALQSQFRLKLMVVPFISQVKHFQSRTAISIDETLLELGWIMAAVALYILTVQLYFPVIVLIFQSALQDFVSHAWPFLAHYLQLSRNVFS